MGPNSQGLSKQVRSNILEVNQPHVENSEKIELRRVECHVTDSLWKRMLRRVFPDQRKQERLPMPPLVGYLGTGRASKPYDLGNISQTGFCLLTDERWIAGTEMPITLQRKDLPMQDDTESFTVQATVVRSDDEGVGFSIVLCEEESKAVHGNPLRVKWMTKAAMAQILEQLKAKPGSEPLDGHSENPVRSAVTTQSGTTSQLNAAFEGGR